MARVKHGEYSAGGTSSDRATAALVSSLSAVVHSQSMSLVWLNLHETDSKSMPSVPATYGHR